MKVLFQNHSFRTDAPAQFIDMTEDVRDVVARSRVRNGMALVYSPHTTCSIVINERESGFIQDFEDLVEGLIPKRGAYRHDDLALRTENLEDDDHDVPNGHAHCKQGLIASASQTIPVIDGALQLGRWQRVFFLELDRGTMGYAAIGHGVLQTIKAGIQSLAGIKLGMWDDPAGIIERGVKEDLDSSATRAPDPRAKQHVRLPDLVAEFGFKLLVRLGREQLPFRETALFEEAIQRGRRDGGRVLAGR